MIEGVNEGVIRGVEEGRISGKWEEGVKGRVEERRERGAWKRVVEEGRGRGVKQRGRGKWDVEGGRGREAYKRNVEVCVEEGVVPHHALAPIKIFNPTQMLAIYE